MDADLERVADFLQRELPVSKLVPVTTAIGRLAPILSGHYDAAEIMPLLLRADLPTSS